MAKFNFKATEILKTFSPNEMKSFGRFINSPYFNESSKIKKLFKLIIKFYPEFNSPDLTETKIQFALNPLTPLNKSTFKSLMFELSDMAEEFLMIENLKSKKLYAQDFLRHEFFKRRLFKYFQQNIVKSEKLLSSIKTFNSYYFLHSFFIATDKYNFFLTQIPRSNQKIISELVLKLSKRASDISLFYLKEIKYTFDSMTTLKSSFVINEQKNFLIKLFNLLEFEKLLKFMISSVRNKRQKAMLNLDLKLYSCFKDFSNENNYTVYKNFFFKNLKFLTFDEVCYQISRIITYCKMKLSDKNTILNFDKELFSIFKYSLQKKSFNRSINVYMPVELYRIIVRHSLKLGKFKWTLDFITKYNSKLHPERRTNMLNHSMGEYYFYKKRFDLALKSLQSVKLNHYMLKVDIKCLMLMAYYELGLYESALSLIDTFKHFLKNSEILNDSVKESCRAFISVIEKMILYKTSVKSKSKFDIKKSISDNIQYESWIHEKYDELEKKVARSA